MTKVTFKSLSRGRYRVRVNGILKGIVKNPKKVVLAYSKSDQNRSRQLKNVIDDAKIVVIKGTFVPDYLTTIGLIHRPYLRYS